MVISIIKKSILCALIAGLVIQPMSALDTVSFQAISMLDDDCTYFNNDMIIQVRLIDEKECKELYHKFPHDEFRCPHAHPGRQDEVTRYSSRDLYKELFSKDFNGLGMYPVNFLILNTGNKPLRLAQDSITLEKPKGKHRPCLIDRSEVSIRQTVWLISGFLLPVIGWFLLYSSVVNELEKFLKEYGLPENGLLLEPGETFETILFIDNTSSAPKPNSFDLHLKIYGQSSQNRTMATEFCAPIINP